MIKNSCKLLLIVLLFPCLLSITSCSLFKPDISGLWQSKESVSAKFLFIPSDKIGSAQGICFGSIPAQFSNHPIYSATYTVARGYIAFKTGNDSTNPAYMWKYKIDGDWMSVYFVNSPDDKELWNSATYHRIKSFKQYKLEHPDDFKTTNGTKMYTYRDDDGIVHTFIQSSQ